MNRFFSSFESVLLGLFLVWTIAIGAALVSPAHERVGTVEIRALG
jgi:hypothetical protein